MGKHKEYLEILRGKDCYVSCSSNFNDTPCFFPIPRLIWFSFKIALAIRQIGSLYHLPSTILSLVKNSTHRVQIGDAPVVEPGLALILWRAPGRDPSTRCRVPRQAPGTQYKWRVLLLGRLSLVTIFFFRVWVSCSNRTPTVYAGVQVVAFIAANVRIHLEMLEIPDCR